MFKTCQRFTVLSARHSNVVETHETIHHVIGQCRNAACRCLQRLVVPKSLCTEDSGEEVAAQDRSSMICGHSAVPVDANLHHKHRPYGRQEFTKTKHAKMR